MKPVRAIKWQNGMLMVFDSNGKQVEEYQGIANEVLPRLKADFPEIEVEYGDWNAGKLGLR